MSTVVIALGCALAGYLYGFRKGQDYQFVHMLGIMLDHDRTPINAGDRRHISRGK